jgi:hypothetical protein
MTLDEIIKKLDLTLLTKRVILQKFPTGYTSDLLSCVMAGAVPPRHLDYPPGTRTNIVAVAALLDLSAVIITEGAMPDQGTIQKANQEGVTLLSSLRPHFILPGSYGRWACVLNSRKRSQGVWIEDLPGRSARAYGIIALCRH